MASRTWWALVPAVLAVLTVGLDGTILSVALPTLGRSLGASTGQLQWFVAAYTLVFAAALVPGGMLGDRYGRKKMLVLALLLFGVASIACALAPSAEAFIAARALLGLGGAVMLPMVLGLLPVLFDEAERPRAVGAITAAAMLGYPIGPLLGGWMLTRFDWSWVFLINVPVVALAVLAVIVLLPESRSSARKRIDVIGVALSAGGLALLTYGVITAGDVGWADRSALAELLAGALALAGLVVWERRVDAPLIDPNLLRLPGFAWGAVLSSIVSFAMFGLLFAAPLYFQVVRGVDAQGSGIRLLPLIAGMLVGGAFADRITARVGARAVASVGFAMLAAALALGATTAVATGDAQALAWVALAGLGLGLVLPTTIDTALGAVSGESSGVSSGVLQALRMVGGALGAAILGAILNATYRDQLEHAVSPEVARPARESAVAGVDAATAAHSQHLLDAVQTAFVSGLDRTLWISAALMAAGGVLALVFRPRARETQAALEAEAPSRAAPAAAGPVPRAAGRDAIAQRSSTSGANGRPPIPPAPKAGRKRACRRPRASRAVRPRQRVLEGRLNSRNRGEPGVIPLQTRRSGQRGAGRRTQVPA
jgi:DHA2 family multidrug resistance protein-like MFS transporter